MLKNYSKVLIPVLLFSFLAPAFASQASSPSYDYRFTKMGSGTRQTGQWEYEITGEKYDFSTGESVFALTRIYDIKNVSNFQFKYEIRGAVERDALSPIYRPNRSWWAEIWYWDEFGPLPAGNYTLGVMLSVDGGAWKRLDSKRFSVDGENQYDSTYEYENVLPDYRCDNPSYHFDWVKTGRGIESQSDYKFELSSATDNFKTNEDVYVLVKNSDIRGTDSFRIKFEVYQNGNKRYRTNEVPTLNPDCNVWDYNYSWGNLGRLPSGNHEIRTYIKFNNGSYRLINTKKISVGTSKTPVKKSTKSTVPANRPTVNPYHFDYDWTQADNDIRFEGNYKYSAKNPREIFSSDEEVKVLTKLTKMNNINSFRIRHELHKDGQMLQKKESPVRKPGSSYWEYNFTESNFGKLSAGNYEVRVFISIEGKPWRYLDTKLISVEGGSHFDGFDYGWTQVGNGDYSTDYGYYEEKDDYDRYYDRRRHEI